MKPKHFIIKRAVIFDERESNDPEDCIYDEIKGLWIYNKDKEILIKSNHPSHSNLTTKKQNIEKT